MSNGGARPLVIAGDNLGHICAFDAGSHEPVWHFEGGVDNQFVWPRLACDLRRLYVMHERFLVALDLANGERLERSPDLGQWNLAAPSVGGKSVFIPARHPGADPTVANQLLCLDPANISTVLARLPIGGDANTVRPVIDRARLYLRLAPDGAGSVFQRVVKAIAFR